MQELSAQAWAFIVETYKDDPLALLGSALGLWGAVVSTILAVLKWREWCRDRHRIETGFSYAGDEEVGNRVYIRNLSSRQFIITYWEVFAAHGKFWRRGYTPLGFAGLEHWDDMPIAAYSGKVLTFQGEYHFGLSDKFLKGRKVYIAVHLAGMRPETQRLYPMPSERSIGAFCRAFAFKLRFGRGRDKNAL
ncbi:hypothetical protein ACIPEN_14130 [Herbaspirillum chlorophenolicum]|uniref:Uncharacterized protein n=1 Tax=Herbaspirillum chlorophenolicum TaxID=211589 RepID=A0ABW8F0Y9_9BURK